MARDTIIDIRIWWMQNRLFMDLHLELARFMFVFLKFIPACKINGCLTFSSRWRNRYRLCVRKRKISPCGNECKIVVQKSCCLNAYSCVDRRPIFSFFPDWKNSVSHFSILCDDRVSTLEIENWRFFLSFSFESGPVTIPSRSSSNQTREKVRYWFTLKGQGNE